MTKHRHRFATGFAAAFAMLALAAPAAEAAKKKIDGQLIAAADAKGSKVEAPVLLSEKSAKRLKLDSPLATLSLKGSKRIAAPDPAGGGEVMIAPGTLRAGDEVLGKGKLKGSAKKLMPTVKAGKIEVVDRESAYSLDEITGALVALYQQVGVLGLRVDALEASFGQLRADLEALKAQNASLQGQIDALLAQITALQTALDELTNIVNGLPTATELEDALQDIADLQSELASLGIGDVAGLQSALDGLEFDIGVLNVAVMGLCAPDPLPLC